MRFFIKLFLFCLIVSLFLALVPLSAIQLQKNTRLNIVLITIDTLRSDRLSCYSPRYLKTPNIDSLAERGTLFSKAFAHTTTTLPSHTNILLGVTPLYHGVHDNLNFIVSQDFTTIAEHLKHNGYNTAAFVGAYPLDSRFGLNQGFDKYDDSYLHVHGRKLTSLERRAEDVVMNAIEGMEDLASPWFVWIHCYDPHLPYDPPEPFRSQFKKSPYEGEVAYVDYILGRFLRYLEGKNLFDRTMVVFTADHGESLGHHGEWDHGFVAYNTTVWVPLIMSAPGLRSGRIDQNVSHIDIFPTICEVVGVKKPAFLQGISLLPALEGKSLPERTIYFESLYPYYSLGWAPLMGFVRHNEKFIASPIPELYDLEKDFDEQKNLAAPESLDRYKSQLETIINEQSLPDSFEKKEKFDRENLEKLKSLGYISSSHGPKKDSFGPEDDVKTLLPFYNQAMRAVDLYERGRTIEAEVILKDLIQKRRDLAMAYINLAFLYVQEDKTDEALETLRSGLSSVSGGYEIYEYYIKTLRRAHRYDEIIQEFNEKSYREISVDPEIWNNVGFAYLMSQEWEKAVEAFNRAVSLDCKFAEAFFNLGKAYLELGIEKEDQNLFQESSENFKKAIETDPTYPSAYFGLGKAYRQMGNLDGAIFCWKKALELQPYYDIALYSLGMAYLDKGDRKKALDCFLGLKERFYFDYPDDVKKRIEDLILKCKI